MKNKLGFISGIGMVILGIWLFSLAGREDELVFLLIYGTICIGLGIYLLFHLKKEDEIEHVKEAKK